MRALTSIVVSLLWAGFNCHAVLLNLQAPTNAPDLLGAFENVQYTSSNKLFLASGFTSDYANGSVSLVDIGSCILTANITSAGVLTGGALSLQGDVGAGQETLLTGVLTIGTNGIAFGYNNGGGNIFEFLFTVTGGNPSVVSDFGGLGASGGVIVDAWFQNGGTPFNGSWSSNFSNDGLSGVSDTFAIPEPSSVLLVLFGCIWVVASGRLRVKQAWRKQ